MVWEKVGEERLEEVPEHTQGPWAVDSNLPPNARTVICRTCDGTPISANHLGPHPPEQDEANARLIATAPELLEALHPFAALAELRGVADSIQYDEYTRFDIAHVDVRRAVAAIAKATTPN